MMRTLKVLLGFMAEIDIFGDVMKLFSLKILLGRAKRPLDLWSPATIRT